MKVSTQGLRFLIAQADIFDGDLACLRAEVSRNIEKFQTVNLAALQWSSCYELDFQQFLATFIVSLDLHHNLKEYKNLDIEDGLSKLSDQIISKLDDGLESLSLDDAKDFTLNAMIIGHLMVSSVKSLMIYGFYINDLIRIARENKNTHKGDSALLKAIRIDPSVIACPTAASRLSFAVLLGDSKFIKKLQNAMSGKLGARESKNFQKMRLILQVLHEAKADQMSDSELNDLFVDQLKIYSDPQGSSEKNLKEFRYNFKKQKSTIQKDKK